MNTTSLLLVFLVSTSQVLSLSEARTAKTGRRNTSTSSHILIMGFVYCDTCSNNTFSTHSYFLPGAEVKIECMFKALSPSTAEQISLSVNRTTDKYGVYKLEIPAVDGIRCADESSIAFSCQASLMRSSSSSCNVPGYKATSDNIAVKSKGDNLCVYSFNALNFRPSKRETSLCGKSKNSVLLDILLINESVLSFLLFNMYIVWLVLALYIY